MVGSFTQLPIPTISILTVSLCIPDGLLFRVRSRWHIDLNIVYLVVELPDAAVLEAVVLLGVELCLAGGLFCGVFVGSVIVKFERSKWLESSRVSVSRI